MSRPVYFAYLRAQLIGILRFRLDFLIGLSSSLLETALSLIFLVTVFAHVKSLAGVPFPEILLMFAFSTLGRSFHLLFFDNLWLLGSRFIQQGELDRLFLRPRKLLFQLIAERANIQGIGQFLVGTIALVWALLMRLEPVNIEQYFLIPLLLLASASIFVLTHICLASLSFWLIDSTGLMTSVFALASFGQYPLGIFPVAINVILVTFLPFAFTGYVPAGLLTQNLGPSWALAEVVAILVLSLTAMLLWKKGVTRYASTGS